MAKKVFHLSSSQIKITLTFQTHLRSLFKSAKAISKLETALCGIVKNRI